MLTESLSVIFVSWGLAKLYCRGHVGLCINANILVVCDIYFAFDQIYGFRYLHYRMLVRSANTGYLVAVRGSL